MIYAPKKNFFIYLDFDIRMGKKKSSCHEAIKGLYRDRETAAKIFCSSTQQ